MRLNQGKIGKQEAANMAGIALVSSAVFVLDITETYQHGNGTYVSFLGAIVLALLLFLLLSSAMSASKQKDLPALAEYAFGKAGAYALAAVLCAFLFINAYCLISRFTTMVHAFVYNMSATPIPVFLWIVPVIAYMAYRGLECIARVAKCFGIFLGGALLLSLLLPMDGYEAYRLFPLPFNRLGSIASTAYLGTFATAPALLALLSMTQGLQGAGSAKQAGRIGALVSIVLVLLVQLAIGMTYNYTELQCSFVPLYRINLKLIQESYFFRLDKLALFIWLIGAMIAGAYYLYAGSFVFCRSFSRYDVRPAVVAGGVMLLCCLAAENTKHFHAVEAAFQAVQQYGAWCIVVPFAAAAATALIKTALVRRKANENA